MLEVFDVQCAETNIPILEYFLCVFFTFICTLTTQRIREKYLRLTLVSTNENRNRP